MIGEAKKYLKQDDLSFEDIISSAQSRYQLAEEERRMAAEARQELDKLREEVKSERHKLEEERARLRTKAKEESKKIIADTRQEMDRLIVEIRNIMGLDQSAADRVIQNSRDSIRKREDELAEPMTMAAAGDSKPPRTVRPGETVRIVTLNQKATVLSAPDAKGDVAVQAGIMKMTVKLSDLRPEKDETQTRGAGTIRLETDRQAGMELDIRGMLVDDAILVVDRYIDNACMSGLSEINIIHGKGTGALRAGIQEFLKRHKRVKSFRLGNYGEGDAGVTVVTLNIGK